MVVTRQQGVQPVGLVDLGRDDLVGQDRALQLAEVGVVGADPHEVLVVVVVAQVLLGGEVLPQLRQVGFGRQHVQRGQQAVLEREVAFARDRVAGDVAQERGRGHGLGAQVGGRGQAADVLQLRGDRGGVQRERAAGVGRRGRGRGGAVVASDACAAVPAAVAAGCVAAATAVGEGVAAGSRVPVRRTRNATTPTTMSPIASAGTSGNFRADEGGAGGAPGSATVGPLSVGAPSVRESCRGSSVLRASSSSGRSGMRIGVTGSPSRCWSCCASSAACSALAGRPAGSLDIRRST